MLSLALTLLLHDGFGTSAALLPDVDADGHADLIVTATEGYRGSRVWLVSGADLSIIVEIETGSSEGASSLYHLRAAEADFNGDRMPDILSHWYVPDGEMGYHETRILDATDPRKVLRTWKGRARVLGPDLDGDGLPDPTFAGMREGRWAVSQVGSDGSLLWRWRGEFVSVEMGWISDASGDGVPDLVVVRTGSRESLPVYLLDGTNGEVLLETELLPVGGLWVSLAATHLDWDEDGAGDFYLSVIDARHEVEFENRVLRISGADLSVLSAWENTHVPKGSILLRALGYDLAVLRGPEGEETCLAGDFEYAGGRGGVLVIEGDTTRFIDSAEGDSRAFGGFIRPGTDWNADGTRDYLVGCASNSNSVPDHGFLEVRDGCTHESLLVLRQHDLVEPHRGEGDSEDD